MHVEFYNKRQAAELGKALRDLGVDFIMKKTSGSGKEMIKLNINTPIDNPELSQQIRQLVADSGGRKKA
jgi:hypothetical protein